CYSRSFSEHVEHLKPRGGDTLYTAVSPQREASSWCCFCSCYLLLMTV
ncbi:hypothetical protein CapIbe_018162, partial [Capra ibex]